MKRVLIISGERFEDLELLVTYYRLKEEGHEVLVASAERGILRGLHGYEVHPDLIVEDADHRAFDALFLPGGKPPAILRRDPRVLEIVRGFEGSGRPVGAICHGPLVLASAGLLRGRRATCYRGVSTDLIEAGALYEDTEVVVESGIVTARLPSDLPAFMREFISMIKHASLRPPGLTSRSSGPSGLTIGLNPLK